MDSIKTYPPLAFAMFGFFFHGNFLNAFILSIIWEEYVSEYFTGSISKQREKLSDYLLTSVNQDILKYPKLTNIVTNMISYYGGHYARNKLPL